MNKKKIRAMLRDSEFSELRKRIKLEDDNCGRQAGSSCPKSSCGKGSCG
ncbi:MAG: hypothetical protein GF375_01605 [Candidatus Omnitrophica bacterium]|nr:hypothetical protein [Candidatus Omnitrophota bacterium]MBD3268823.1 hypothetical protein [Candidatus Omnitrophota bacterium]